RNQEKMYSIFFTILERRVKEGKKSGRRKEEWKKERIEERRVKKEKKSGRRKEEEWKKERMIFLVIQLNGEGQREEEPWNLGAGVSEAQVQASLKTLL